MDIRISDIARQFNLEIEGNREISIRGLCGLSDNLPDHLAFIDGTDRISEAQNANIPAFVAKADCIIAGKTTLIHADPDYAMGLIASLFKPSELSFDKTISASATVHSSAILGEDVVLGEQVVIGAGVTIGARTRIYPNTVVMDRTKIGDDCIIYPNCVVREDSVLGVRVILQPGVIIGGDGYGYHYRQNEHIKIPQLGNVILEDDVEIGANSAIDRGRFTATRIGKGTKVDNLVMIAHNVQVGEKCLLVSQTGISGSSKLGNNVTLAGQVGIVGHVNICDGVTALGQSMVTKDIRQSGFWAGSPARPAKLWRKAMARFYSAANKRND